jgi:histidinol-phosphate aminotransferase
VSWVVELARPEIRALKAYQHAAWEPSLTRMHANELPWRVAGDPSEAGLNRYPEPQPPPLVEAFAALYGVGRDQVLVGRGSDEAIDLLVRIFCRAQQDSIIVCPPTYSMYAVAAGIQGAGVIGVPLLAGRGFALDADAILAQVTSTTRLVFVCSPNNPTGNLLDRATMLDLARRLAPRALLVVDEAYIEFTATASLAPEIAAQPNIAVMRTLSKSHGLAGARCGVLLAAPEVIALARKVIPPYAVTELTVEAVRPLLTPAGIAAMQARIDALLVERTNLARGLGASRLISRVYPSDANFLLIDSPAADEVLARVRGVGLIIRDVRQPLLPQALRISIGTPEQNALLLRSLA